MSSNTFKDLERANLQFNSHETGAYRLLLFNATASIATVFFCLYLRLPEAEVEVLVNAMVLVVGASSFLVCFICMLVRHHFRQAISLATEEDFKLFEETYGSRQVEKSFLDIKKESQYEGRSDCNLRFLDQLDSNYQSFVCIRKLFLQLSAVLMGSVFLAMALSSLGYLDVLIWKLAYAVGCAWIFIGLLVLITLHWKTVKLVKKVSFFEFKSMVLKYGHLGYMANLIAVRKRHRKDFDFN